MFLMVGFHRYSPGFSKEEEESRANTWWDIYLFDRYLDSLNLSDVESWQDNKVAK
jgi:hypothetical protein